MIRVQETALYLQNSLIIKCDQGYLILLELFGLEKAFCIFLPVWENIYTGPLTVWLKE